MRDTHPLACQLVVLTSHEPGHYMLHRYLVGDGIDGDRAYRSTHIGKYHNTLIGPEEETNANRFAVNLLMPKDLIRAAWSQDGATVESMAELFQVSKNTMSIRLGVPYKA